MLSSPPGAFSGLLDFFVSQWPWIGVSIAILRVIWSSIKHGREIVAWIVRLARKRRSMGANGPRPLSRSARRALLTNVIWAGICLGLVSYQISRDAKADSLRRRSIIIIENEAVPHIQLASSAFRTAIQRELGDSSRVIIKTGTGTDGGDVANKAAFEAALAELSPDVPDLLVTVGTGVSAYAAQHYADLPRFFLVVTDPTDPVLGLVSKADLVTRSSNVCGYGAGIHLDSMASMLRECFPGVRLGFLFDSSYSQDRRVREFMEKELPGLLLIDRVGPDWELPEGVRANVKLVFGWNYLNVNIAKLVTANPKVAFLGPQSLNFSSPVVACYGADYAMLAEEAAKFVIHRHLLKGGVPLGNLPIQLPDAAYLRKDAEQLKRKGLAIAPGCVTRE